MNQSTPPQQNPTYKSKTCARCEHPHPAADFYRNRRNSDGLDSWCKTCRRSYMASWHKKRPEYHRAYYHVALKNNADYQARRRAWWKNKVATDPEFVRRRRSYARQRFRENPSLRALPSPREATERSRKYRIRDPLAYKAHKAVTVAARNGVLPRANTQMCVWCGNPARHYHHHLGYSPEHCLSVIPLCPRCHGAAHRKT